MNDENKSNQNTGKDSAANLIREKLDRIYSAHTNPKRPAAKNPSTLIDKFWDQHDGTSDHQSAWQAFYSKLPEDQKSQLWNEYHHTQDFTRPAQSSTNTPARQPVSKEPGVQPVPAAKPQQQIPAKPKGPGLGHIFKSLAKSKHPIKKPMGSQIKPKPPATTSSPETKTPASFSIPTHKPSAPPPKANTPIQPNPKTSPTPAIRPSIADTRELLMKKMLSKPLVRPPSFFDRNKGAILTGATAAFLMLFLSYNQVAVAKVKKYVSPGNTISSPIIIDPNAQIEVGEESRIIIPKINVDVPVVYDIKNYDEDDIQAGLERGVVHYGETALPGSIGNNVIVGHSSSNFFNKGKYKFAFVLLDELEENDTFILHHEGTRYVYRVFNSQIIEPNDFSLIQPTSNAITTLITCTPPGTNWRRLVIQGEQISPEPRRDDSDQKAISPQDIETQIIPSNSQSFWDRWF